MLNNQNYARFLPYNGSLTYPRRLGKRSVNGRTYLTQQFIRLEAFDQPRLDMRAMVDEEVAYVFTVNKPHLVQIKLQNLNCDQDCDFELKFEDQEMNNTISIGYTHATNEFYLDRSKSPQINDRYNEPHKYKRKYEKLLNNNEFLIELILDMDTVELLTDHGLVALSAVHLNHRIFETLTIASHKNYLVDPRVNSYES